MSSDGVSNLRSGGKIVRPRRTNVVRTPYERSPHQQLMTNSGSQNPNWLSRFVLSPTRIIATGAGKVLSVFRQESSSSSSSSSDGDFTSEEDDDDDGEDISSEDANKLEKSSLHDVIPKAFEWKSQTKLAIEQLLLQETFSREECDRLTSIIKSRVVDSPVIDGRLTEIPDTTVGSDAGLPALTAITEAKKWLQEKKLGSTSKSELDFGIGTLNTAMLPVTESDVGSPIDMAKSYMQARPPWASPSMSNIQSRSPSVVFKEETSCLFSDNSLSASKLIRNSPPTSSWSIQDEIRKVRSRATEEMLKRRPSSTIDWSGLSSDNRRSPNPLVAYKTDSVLQIAQDELHNESVPRDLATSIVEQNQDLGVAEIIDVAEGMDDGLEGKEMHRQRVRPYKDVKADTQVDADGECLHLNSTVGGDTQAEVAGRDGAAAANGFPSGSSLYGAQEREETHKPFDEQQPSVGSGHGDMTRNASVEVTCELISETFIEVPISESDIVATGSQNSSSMHHEGVSLEAPIRALKRKDGKSNVVPQTEKRQVGKRKYVRQPRGRGK
ncbi:protein KAKU4 isoform X2 [Mercurialis annua]|uniref:protein KAKU4 isoform X2 n=1 Tax=Mercurialis annua TaxID=3986 RepID=UPI0021606931|nr:protein KAKU4 isoform X2 [Mercurialis annua]